MCDCIRKMNATLAGYGLKVPTRLEGDPEHLKTAVLITLNRLDRPYDHGLPSHVTSARYCPWCGEGYETEGRGETMEMCNVVQEAIDRMVTMLEMQDSRIRSLEENLKDRMADQIEAPAETAERTGWKLVSWASFFRAFDRATR